jgi:hypothetical protein
MRGKRVTYYAIATIVIYYSSFLFYYQQLFPSSKNRWFHTALSLLVIAAVYGYLVPLDVAWLILPALLIMVTAGLRMSTEMDWLQALYGGGTCVISAYCFRGIFSVIFALVIQNQDQVYLLDPSTYYGVTMFALPVALLFSVATRKILLHDDMLKRFLDNRSQLKPVVAYEITAIVNLSIINQGRLFMPNAIWYSGIALGACVLSIGMLIYSIHYSIRATELSEHRLHNKILEEQYALQLRHYRSYQIFTEGFRAFRHDYTSMMLSLKSLIQAHEDEMALQLIDSMCDTMETHVKVHKKYSNNVVLDAMMQDLVEQCEENEIRLSFTVFVPQNTSLSLIDGIRIFYNVTHNAVEACCKVPVQDRFIEITSGNEDGWVSLQIVNAYDGNVLMKNGTFLTTKAEKDGHGFGLSIVKEIVGNLNGVALFTPDPQAKTFLTRVLIPQLRDARTPLPEDRRKPQAPQRKHGKLSDILKNSMDAGSRAIQAHHRRKIPRSRLSILSIRRMSPRMRIDR